MNTYRIAAIPGDGIGQEVIPAGIEVLAALEKVPGKFRMTFETFDWGSDYYHAHGRMMPADGLETLRTFDAIYFGAVGHPTVPDHISLWGLRLCICQGFDQICQCPSSAPPSRHSRPHAGSRAERPGLGHHPREFRR